MFNICMFKDVGKAIDDFDSIFDQVQFISLRGENLLMTSPARKFGKGTF